MISVLQYDRILGSTGSSIGGSLIRRNGLRGNIQPLEHLGCKIRQHHPG
jgi:hypothetical protein